MIKLVADNGSEVRITKRVHRIKLVSVDPDPAYTQGFIDGIGILCRIGLLVAFHYGKEMSRILLEVAGPGRNLDGIGIKSSSS